jgi:Rieske 2Fe-2S family protein
MFVRVEALRPFFIWPLSPTKCLVECLTLLPKEQLANPHFDEYMDIYRKRVDVINDEDRSMVESLQNAMGSRNFEPGRMSRLEKGVQHIMKYNLSRILPHLSALDSGEDNGL